MSNELSKSQELIRYASSAFYASIIIQFLYPLEVIKTRLQSHDGGTNKNLVPKYSGIGGAIRTIFKEEGMRGFGKGIMVSLVVNSLSRILFFVFFEERKAANQEKLGKNSGAAVMLASIYASSAVSFLTQPLWMINTRVQLNVKTGGSGLGNAIFCVREIMNQYGVFGFYRGLSLTLFLCLHGVIQINSYELMMMMVYQRNKQLYIYPFVCGLVSKALAIFITYPLSTLRTRIQQNQFLSSTPKYLNIKDLIFKTLKNEGLRGFWKGVGASMLKSVPQKGIYFVFYEQMKNKLNISRNQ